MKSLTSVFLCTLICISSTAWAKQVGASINFGDDVRIKKKRDIEIRAQCLNNENGEGFNVLRVYAAIEGNRGILSGVSNYPGNGFYLTASTPPRDSVLVEKSFPVGFEDVSAPPEGGGFVFSLDTMKGFAVNAESALMGLNVIGVADCLLSIDIEEIKRFKRH